MALKLSALVIMLAAKIAAAMSSTGGLYVLAAISGVAAEEAQAAKIAAHT